SPRLFADLPTRVVAVHLRKADIEQEYVRPEPGSLLDRVEAVVRQLGLASFHLEQHCKGHGGIFVVVDDEDAAGGSGRIFHERYLFVLFLCLRRSGFRKRESHGEGASAPRPGARRRNAAPMQPDETLDDREPDAEPALGLYQRMIDLREHLEHVRELVRWNPDAVVAYDGDGLISVAAHLERDRSAVTGVLARVRQQVSEHLRKADGVAVENHWFRGHRNLERLAGLIEKRPAGLGCLLDDRRKLEPLAAKVELVARDAAYVEQVVDQPYEMRHLTFHQRARVLK